MSGIDARVVLKRVAGVLRVVVEKLEAFLCATLCVTLRRASCGLDCTEYGQEIAMLHDHKVLPSWDW